MRVAVVRLSACSSNSNTSAPSSSRNICIVLGVVPLQQGAAWIEHLVLGGATCIRPA